MTRLPTAAALLLALLLVTAAPAATIIVDGSGGGDFLTIQEGVDAAADYGDTVLVMPGLYDDIHFFDILGSDRAVNVFFEKSLTLTSTGGPDVTFVDGQGATEHGIVGMPDPDYPFPGDPPPPVVEGFTVRNGFVYFYSAGIIAVEGEARGNTVSGYGAGICNTPSIAYAGIAGHRGGRGNTPLIDGNTCTGNETGIAIRPTSDLVSDAIVTDNIVFGNSAGVSVRGPDGHIQVIGNEITDNTYGLGVYSGPSNHTGTVNVDIKRNVIASNADRNMSIYCDPPSMYPYVVRVTIGGALEDANDVYGSPLNLSATDWGGHNDVVVDASYNYWGSIYCDEFEPLFYTEDIPDTCFIYFPFTGEPHAAVYPTCDSVATEEVTWGAIKALFR